MSKSYPLYILAGALFILGLSLGFFAGKQFNMSSVKMAQPERQQSNQSANQLFSSQTASIRGVITNIEGNKLTVKNLNTNASGDVLVSARVTITKLGKPGSSDVSTLELNQEVLINLEMIGGNFQAISIQYPNPTPSLPPVASLKPAPPTATTSAKP